MAISSAQLRLGLAQLSSDTDQWLIANGSALGVWEQLSSAQLSSSSTQASAARRQLRRETAQASSAQLSLAQLSSTQASAD
jgi:hypothetical protein